MQHLIHLASGCRLSSSAGRTLLGSFPLCTICWSTNEALYSHPLACKESSHHSTEY